MSSSTATAGTAKHHAIDTIGMTQGEFLRHHTAKRNTHHVAALPVEGI
jgi:hypothetical protein